MNKTVSSFKGFMKFYYIYFIPALTHKHTHHKTENKEHQQHQHQLNICTDCPHKVWGHHLHGADLPSSTSNTRLYLSKYATQLLVQALLTG